MSDDGREDRPRAFGVASLVALAVAVAVAVAVAAGWATGRLPPRTATPGVGGAAEFGPVTVLDTYAGVPAGVPSPGETEAGDAWDAPPLVDLEDAAVTLWTGGSSSCPTVPSAIRAEGDLVQVVVGVPEGPGDCTMDFRVTTYVVALPAGYAPDDEPTVEVVDRDSPDRSSDDLPDRTPTADGLATCRPALTVCAMNRWLDDMLRAAGYAPSPSPPSAVAGRAHVDVDGGQLGWSLYPRDRDPGRAPMQVARTRDVGEVVVEHGTRTSGVTPAAGFTCGGFRVEAEAAGFDVPAEVVAEVVDATAATVSACPADLDELLARYPDLVRPGR